MSVVRKGFVVIKLSKDSQNISNNTSISEMYATVKKLYKIASYETASISS